MKFLVGQSDDVSHEISMTTLNGLNKPAVEYCFGSFRREDLQHEDHPVRTSVKVSDPSA